MSVRITPKKREALNQLGIQNQMQILNYFPYRYEILQYVQEKDWAVDSKIVTEAVVVKAPKMSRFKGNQSVVYVDCETEFNMYKVSIFNRPWIIKQLPVGTRFTVIGRYQGANRILAMQINFNPLSTQLGIHPIYSLKDQLTDKYFTGLVDAVLQDMHGQIEDFVPEQYRNKYGFMNREDAYRNMHQPKESNQLILAKNSLKYEEFLQFNLIMQARKKQNVQIGESFAKNVNVKLVQNFIQQMPFTLTKGQATAVDEIVNDMISNKQMFRLLQGDVGCGKTAVGFIGMYAAYTAGKQSAMMAPTEILAKQHFENLKKTFSKYDIKVALLYSSQSNEERLQVLSGLEDGSIKMVVGTHALFQQMVVFNNLGFIITDEQHRFGVKQRQSLLLKGNKADVLLMSATPIPRTLATSLYGDLDVSTITETPNKGKTIHTLLIRQNSFTPKLDEIEDLLAKGNQMYVICPSIEKGMGSARNVNDIYNNLKKYFNGRYTVGLLHGQLDEQVKNDVQQQFASGEIDILVSTTVIEVGVDVKNANIMIIYDANRFGLSQLHQLRGRVGRGEREGYCYLLTSSQEPEALKKLEIIEKNMDGFKIAFYDLQMRGPGDLMGYRQSGLPEFILGNVIEDTDILNHSLEDAKEILKNIDSYPNIKSFIQQKEKEAMILS